MLWGELSHRSLQDGIFSEIPGGNPWRRENRSFINGGQGTCLAASLQIPAFPNCSVYPFGLLFADLLMLEGKEEISDQYLCKQWIRAGTKHLDSTTLIIRVESDAVWERCPLWKRKHILSLAISLTPRTSEKVRPLSWLVRSRTGPCSFFLAQLLTPSISCQHHDKAAISTSGQLPLLKGLSCTEQKSMPLPLVLTPGAHSALQQRNISFIFRH